MRIASVDYNHETNAIEVFVSGCTLKCKGCHNKPLQDFSYGEEWKKYISDRCIKWNAEITKRVMIMGGEPFDQDIKELTDMVGYLHSVGFKEIWIFTGYNSFCGMDIPYVTHLKCGPYIEGRDSIEYVDQGTGLTITLASDNQCVIKLQEC